MDVIDFLKIREIRTEDEFQALNRIWNSLLSKSNDDNIFLTWEWMSTWWKYYGNEHQLHVMVAEKEEEIVSIAPLMCSNYSIFGTNLKEIGFIGTPDSDYNGFILTNQKRESLRLFLNRLLKDSHEWDFLAFKDMPENSESTHLFPCLFKSNRNFVERTTYECPFLLLPGSYEEFYRTLGRKLKKNIRNRENRLRKLGHIEFKMYNEFATTEEAMRAFFVLHQKRWCARGQGGFFADTTKRAFHLEIAQRFADKGWLRLCFLTINDKPIATQYSFEFKQKIYEYLSGFDPEYSEYGVGRLIDLYLIKYSIEKKLKEFDFTRGLETYKSDWKTYNRKNLELRFAKNRFLSEIYRLRFPHTNIAIPTFLKKVVNRFPYAIKTSLKDKFENLA